MARLHPGWFVSLFGAGVSVSSWLPWLTASADGGGRASAIGGTFGAITLTTRFGPGQLVVLAASVLVVLGAMAARNLSARAAASAAVGVSLLIGVLTWWFFHVNLVLPMRIGYGFFIAAACAVAALACSIWALVATLSATAVLPGGDQTSRR